MNTDSKPGAATHQDHLHEHAGRSTSMDIETRQMLTSRNDLKRRHFRKQLYGRHGDIKPENILWFRDPKNKNDKGVLKISDFGLTEFSTRHTLCYKRNSQVAHSPSYRPPECDLEGAVVGPSYDIWTLGCLYLELITWQLGGAKLLREFRENRMIHDPLRLQSTDTFFEIVYCEGINKLGAMVKPAVLDVSMLHDFAHPLHRCQSAGETNLNSSYWACTPSLPALRISTNFLSSLCETCWSSNPRTRGSRVD